MTTAIVTTAMYLYVVVLVGDFLLNDRPRSRMGVPIAVWIVTFALFCGAVVWYLRNRENDNSAFAGITAALVGAGTCLLIVMSISAFG